MGSGIWNNVAYATYNSSVGKSYDTVTNRVINQSYKAVRIDAGLNPQNFNLRECANSEEHPNTIPVILALDVTGSMGPACNETAEALGVIMTELYDKFKDIELCVMGIGDLAYDDAPVQMSQFESDVRIAEALDKIYMEKGGGGNGFERSRNPENYIPAPTLQMAMKWLREVHNIHPSIVCDDVAEFVFYRIERIFRTGKEHRWFSYYPSDDDKTGGAYPTCEQACEAAIKYCLENLI